MAELIALMGAPGSGKSSLAATYAGSAEIVDFEVFRERASVPGYIVAAKLKKIERLLGGGQSVVVDSCLTQAATRGALLRLAERAGAQTRLVLVDAPLSRCLAVQGERESPVPEQKVRELHAKVQQAWERAKSESWNVRERTGDLAPIHSREW